ncbi:MAG TPA: glycoside hydrolase family 88 protein [Pyrinomonadaceae bacterium]|nr:glycoside hydrolase family 88 protein [Pyrinomonadaceae bacterium]
MRNRREFIRELVLCVGAITVAPRLLTAQPLPAYVDPWQSVAQILDRIKPPRFPKRTFYLDRFGARADGQTDCTAVFRRAIDECSKAGGGKVVVPAGTYLTGAIQLKNNVNLEVSRGAVIKFSQNPKDYLPVVFSRWEGVELFNYSPFIYAFEQRNIAITGEGTLDGQSDNEHWWPWNGRPQYGWKEGMSQQRPDRMALFGMAEKGVPVRERIFGEGHYLRPQFIQPYRCQNVLIDGVTIQNSPMWEIHPVLCRNVTVQNVKISSHGPNNDGCDPESCTDVLIKDCYFDTGDDCIAIKSGRNADGRRVNAPTENIIVQGCQMKDGHGGITVGSEISGGVRNLFAENCRLDSPNLDHALRVKNNAMRGGLLEHLHFRNIEVGQVAHAVITIDFNYEEGAKGSFTPVVRDYTVQNLRSGRSKHALDVQGLPAAPITNLRLTNCTFDNVAEGNILKHVREVSFANVKVNGRGIEEKQASEQIAATAMTALWRDASKKESGYPAKWTYDHGLVLKGIERVWENTRDKQYLDFIQRNMDHFVNDDGSIRTYSLDEYNIDNILPGRNLLFLYRVTGQQKYRKAAALLREQLMTHPRTSEGGFWHKKIYPSQMWLDGLYMGEPFYAEYAATFHEEKAFDDIAKQFILMERHSRDSKTGLLFHGWDESRKQRWSNPQTGRSPNFWARAIGWYAMALVDTLDYFPRNHPQRSELIAILNRLARAIAKYQELQSGLWYQVVDKGDEKGNYLEASAACMFVYALAKGVRKGYLPANYMQVAERGYRGILREFVKTDANGQTNLEGTVSVGGLGGNPYRDGSYEYYLSEKVITNDPKGIGALLLAATEMEQKARTTGKKKVS